MYRSTRTLKKNEWEMVMSIIHPVNVVSYRKWGKNVNNNTYSKFVSVNGCIRINQYALFSN